MASLFRPEDKTIWAIAGPAIIANSSTPLVGLVDTWVIGHLPVPVHLAAIGVGSFLFSFIFWAFGFLRMSTTGLVAQAHGTGDHDQIARILVRSSALGMFIGIIIVGFQAYLFQTAMLALAPPEKVMASAETYFSIRIWAAPATLFIYSITGFLIGTARAKAALWVQLVLNGVNATLNLIFVLGFDMNVAGIALGSLIAEWLAAIMGLAFTLHYLGAKRLYCSMFNHLTWRAEKLKLLLSANGYIFARTLLLITGFALLTREAASLGTEPLAANQVLLTFLTLIALGLDAFAYAAEALTGAAYGKRSLIEFRFYVKRTTLWALGFAAFYSLLFWLGGDFIISTLTSIESVRRNAGDVMWLIGMLPLVSLWCYQFDGIYIGVTEGKGMFITMVGAFTVYISVIGPMADTWGLTGLWGAMLLFSAARGVGQALYYPRIEARFNSST